ncbi:bifunctional 5,10-methylenetetrahydrofolate dehydrogenase/5,10-methenyltetrahydrofolate cyclohydrolase [Streptomyces griseocarneus]|uniref:bifunctional 5,10-methylenetetrahydrofolate dehydrogenase/5,10-methenyltetrahydrofolate cyclohydrolase n=1 Tax=Streptomyces griseocarneus TaxID=51201 RepID=UPI00167C7247|nr:bifunctional 5,10-methylenetetrahydrofolate dehydrogenase/5,10-methenyltetrahydrofolate cyclohydrolase [Streptomyces griseocarneus]MBZ6476243.1 bifunctional 5,10-methylenetetrahydrofolate dehydrogenase/5,10-methenyltetrahydrofolate cyclohydrolase [Streptomyces griseocarneus]GHG63144.1 bifunctional protein FolD [Streptomyces griseocarneus]
MTTHQLSGTDLLRTVRGDLEPYRQAIQPNDQRVAVLRFLPADNDPPHWARRMEASRVSADQKVRAFTHLGFDVDHVALPGTVSTSEFADRLDAYNADPRVQAIIVQMPAPAHLTPLVQRLEPAKDIDGLLHDRSLQRACATADGIARIVTPFADNASIAVVGARGFVGSGVVRLLQDQGMRVMPLDMGDDLRRAAQADIVVSTAGNPHLLTTEHIRPHHRLVVDSGFTPLADGTVAGDIHPEAARLPQNITPVPGGVGPVEMAVLMERAVRQTADPNVPSWTFPAAPYKSRVQFAATMHSLGRPPARPTSHPDFRMPPQLRGPGTSRGHDGGRAR